MKKILQILVDNLAYGGIGVALVALLVILLYFIHQDMGIVGLKDGLKFSLAFGLAIYLVSIPISVVRFFVNRKFGK